jgi:hypothetical protein
MTILLSSCQLCRRVQDEDDAVWLDLDDYLFRHDAGRAEVIFAHTYCEDCATSYHQLMTYGLLDAASSAPPA